MFRQEAEVRNTRQQLSGTPAAMNPIRIGMIEQLQNGESAPSTSASSIPGSPRSFCSLRRILSKGI